MSSKRDKRNISKVAKRLGISDDHLIEEAEDYGINISSNDLSISDRDANLLNLLIHQRRQNAKTERKSFNNKKKTDTNEDLEQLAKFALPSWKIRTPTIVELINVNEEFLKHVLDHPEAIQDLNPKSFEDLVDSIFRNQGFNVERLGSTYEADGGVDIIAVSKSIEFGEIRLAIQCKTIQKGTKSQTISAKPMRELAGVLNKFRAHKGILTTTGMFSKKAWLESEQHFSRISLEDRNALVERIRTLFPSST